MTSKTCGQPILIRAETLDGRNIDVIVRCTKAIGHHCWAGKKRDPIHTHRAEGDHQNMTLGAF